MTLYEKLSGGLAPEQHRIKSKAESTYRTKDPATLKQRKENILPYLEFGTGVQAWGERDISPNVRDLLWTLPVVVGSGVGAVKAVKEVYSRATTVPVWRGIRDKLELGTLGSATTTKAMKSANIKGSPLYDEVLHTTMNPSLGIDYAIDEVFKFGGSKESGRLLKFRVPKKYFKKEGVLGPFQGEAEEVIFKKGLPTSMLEYSKKPSELNPLQHIENWFHSFGRIEKYPKDAFGVPIISPLNKKLTKLNEKARQKRFSRADKLEKGGMKRQYSGDAEWYGLNSELRFTNPKGIDEVFQILARGDKRPLKVSEIARLKYLGWKFPLEKTARVSSKKVSSKKEDLSMLLEEPGFSPNYDIVPKKKVPKVIMVGVRPGKPK